MDFSPSRICFLKYNLFYSFDYCQQLIQYHGSCTPDNISFIIEIPHIKHLTPDFKWFDFDNIRIEYDFGILETTRKYYLENGKFKHYGQNHLEKQIFLPLEQYGIERAKNWEQDQIKKNCVVKSEKNNFVI